MFLCHRPLGLLLSKDGYVSFDVRNDLSAQSEKGTGYEYEQVLTWKNEKVPHPPQNQWMEP